MSQKGKKLIELLESSKWLQTIYTERCLLIWHNMRHGMSYDMYVLAHGINLLATMVADKDFSRH